MFTIRKEQMDSLAKARGRDILDSQLQPFRDKGLKAEVDPLSFDVMLTSAAGDSARLTPQPDGVFIHTKEGRSFRIEHGARRRLAAVTDPAGLRIGFEPDEQGRLVAIHRGPHSSYTLNYDELGSVASLAYPDKTSNRFGYGIAGKVTSVTNRNGSETRYEYAETGEVTRVVDARGQETSFEYDGWTLPSAIRLSNGDRHQFEYDPQGRPAKILVNGTVHATFRYDDDQNAHTIEYADRSSTRFLLQGERIVEAINETCTVKFKYDDKGRMVREDTDGRVIQYLRNEIGLLVGIVTPDGEKIRFDRDGDQNVTRITDWAGGRYGFRYESNGAVSQIEYPNGSRMALKSTAMGLSESLNLFSAVPSTSAITSCAWTYDVCDRVTSFERDSERREYRYDAEGRLLDVVAARPVDSAHYELDASGNRIKDGSLSCVINELNQVVQRDGQTFTYDSLGNMTSGLSPKGAARYSYNGRGLLVSVRTATGETYYGYDAFGRRAYKRSAGSFTRYTWAGQQLLSEVTTAEGKMTRRDYLYFPERPFPLAMRIDGAVHYIHPGRLGEPLCVTNARNAVVWKADYSAFGEARITTEQISQPFRLAGQYFDEETGLHYALMRYYNPELGRYLTMDPMRTEGGSLNFYTYCDGDPLNRYDPTGGLIIPAILIAAAIGAVIGAAIGAGIEAYRQHKEHGEIKDGWAIAKAAGIGAVIGAIGGAVGAAVEIAAAGAMTVAAVGALAGGVSAGIEYCAEVALTEATWDWSMLGVSLVAGVGAGAVTAGVGGLVAARAARKAAAIAAREAEELAARELAENAVRGAAKTSAKNPDVIALGLSTCREKVTLPNGQVIEAPRDNVLGDFAQNVDGSGKPAATWQKFDPVVDPESNVIDLGATIKNAMKDAKEIHFNREGMTNFDEIVKNPDPSLYKPPSTNWELATILSDPTLKPKVKIYNGPGNPD